MQRKSWLLLFILFVPYLEAFESSFCENISVNASWLYWKVNGDDFDFAIEKTTRIGSTAGWTENYFEDMEPDESESIHDLKFDWDSGFRIGLGLCPCKTDWGVQLDWTHFDTSSSRHFDVSGSNINNIDIGFPVVDGDFSDFKLNPHAFAHFTGSLNFRYDVVDLELGRWCLECGCAATFRPHIGLRFARIHESFKDRFFVDDIEESGLFREHLASEFSTKNHFQGAGVRAGFDFDVCLCKGFSFIGRSAASLIWGNTKIKNRYAVDFEESFTGPSGFDLALNYANKSHEHYRQTRAITDLSLGLRYQFCACGCYPVTLEAAWEHHLLFAQHRFFVDDSLDTVETGLGGNDIFVLPRAPTTWKNKGTVAMQGLTLTGGIQF